MSFAKINNWCLFFVTCLIPFLNTFSRNFLKYLTFLNLSGFLLLYYIVFCFSTNKRFFSKKIAKIPLCALLLFSSQSVSAVFAYYPDLAAAKLFTELQFVVVFLIVHNLIIDDNSYKRIIEGILVGFLISSVIGVLQYKGVKQFYIYTQDELNKNAGLTFESGLLLNRIWGPFGNSLLFSEYLSPVGLFLYSYYRLVRKRRVLAFFLLALSLYVIVLTVSRTALFASAFAFLLVEFIYARMTGSKAVLYLIFAGFIGTILVLLLSPGIQSNGNPLISRFTKVSQDLKVGRLNLWIKGFSAFSKNVLFGVGPGNLDAALASEGFPMTSDVIAQFDGQHVENYFLTVLYTYGICGFASFAALCFYLVTYSFRLFLNFKKSQGFVIIGGTLFGAVVAFLICNITIPCLVSDGRIRLLFIFFSVIISNSYIKYSATVSLASKYVSKMARNTIRK